MNNAHFIHFSTPLREPLVSIMPCNMSHEVCSYKGMLQTNLLSCRPLLRSCQLCVCWHIRSLRLHQYFKASLTRLTMHSFFLCTVLNLCPCRIQIEIKGLYETLTTGIANFPQPL